MHDYQINPSLSDIIAKTRDKLGQHMMPFGGVVDDLAPQYRLWTRTGRRHVAHRLLWSWSRWGPKETEPMHWGCLDVDSRIQISPRQTSKSISQALQEVFLLSMRLPQKHVTTQLFAFCFMRMFFLFHTDVCWTFCFHINSNGPNYSWSMNSNLFRHLTRRTHRGGNSIVIKILGRSIIEIANLYPHAIRLFSVCLWMMNWTVFYMCESDTVMPKRYETTQSCDSS
jgi:hypothetical protein